MVLLFFRSWFSPFSFVIYQSRIVPWIEHFFYRFSWEDRMTQQEEWKLQKVCLKIQFSALELDFRVQFLPRIECCIVSCIHKLMSIYIYFGELCFKVIFRWSILHIWYSYNVFLLLRFRWNCCYDNYLCINFIYIFLNKVLC